MHFLEVMPYRPKCLYVILQYINMFIVFLKLVVFCLNCAVDEVALVCAGEQCGVDCQSPHVHAVRYLWR